jgi:hypothetical protein
MDQELGYTYLDFRPSDLGIGGNPHYIRDEEMAQEIVSLALARITQHGARALADSNDLAFAADRHSFLSRSLALSAHLPPDAPLLLHPALLTDYLPYMGAMVAFDDANEGVYRATEAAPSFENLKGERRSKRLNVDLVETYHRHLRLGGEDNLALVRGLMLPVS